MPHDNPRLELSVPSGSKPGVELSGRHHIKMAIHGEFYRWARSWVEGKIVLDAGCGNGFGAVILAETAEHVTGIDIDESAIARASQVYSAENVDFQVMDCENMTFRAASFDVIICNALFEYLSDFAAFMEGAFRILKPGGSFVCGTKNLLLSLKNPDGSPLYRNHLVEFSPSELQSVLEKYYTNVKVYGERMSTRSEAYIMNARALKIEWLLVALGIKHRIPKSWRNSVRKLITGVDVGDIASSDFEISEQSLDDALYTIGVGTKA